MPLNCNIINPNQKEKLSRNYVIYCDYTYPILITYFEVNIEKSLKDSKQILHLFKQQIVQKCQLIFKTILRPIENITQMIILQCKYFKQFRSKTENQIKNNETLSSIISKMCKQEFYNFDISMIFTTLLPSTKLTIIYI
ncbi:unnamed protein product [Paramecium octaurelia]|uniref:Uncharacterized protein n=1 Tax=Paramecium octaurelia TaxID=43137 RepID=A0A8S1XRY1_PAROT|nr:unnamed protein product [Paramecium octaurelia]